MIAAVMRFVNGMVMVFDENGEQMPEYQGPWDKSREAILRDKPDSVAVEGPVEWPRPGGEARP